MHVQLVSFANKRILDGASPRKSRMPLTPCERLTDSTRRRSTCCVACVSEDGASGLTAPRLSALSVVVFRGPLTLGALAAAEQVRPPTMTRLVAALEADGLVAREPDPRDGRGTLVTGRPPSGSVSWTRAARGVPRRWRASWPRSRRMSWRRWNGRPRY